MASSSACNLFTTIPPRKKFRLFQQSFQVKAQSYRERQGGSRNNIVDANLCILRERIKEIKTKEKLERCCVAEAGGWNYAPVYDLKYKRDKEMALFLRLVGTIFGTFGFAIFSCSFGLWIVSFLVHLNYQ